MSLLDWLYPPKCVLCQALEPACPCDACLSQFPPCDQGMVVQAGALSYHAAAFRYEGKAMQAVKALKYDRATALATGLARCLRGAFDAHRLTPDVIVPVPIHWRRRCFRGFNQSELLAEALPEDLLAPALLVRIRNTQPQVRVSREQRETNLVGAFRAHAPVPDHVLLIDDVYTTGHTATECARTLVAAGARRVGILTLCTGSD